MYVTTTASITIFNCSCKFNHFPHTLVLPILMVADICREIQDSYHDNFRKLSRSFEVSRKFYLDRKKVFLKIYHDKVYYLLC